MGEICSVVGCEKHVQCKNLCGMHYRRFRVHGDVNFVDPTRNGAPERFLHEVAYGYTGDGCLQWPFAKDINGYGLININRKSHRVTRLVCEHQNGPAPSPRHEAAHSCGNGHLGCCNPNHLRWATHQENMADMISDGNSIRGHKNPSAVLTEEQVLEIRRLGKSMSHRALARRFGVSAGCVHHIMQRRSWSWL